MITKRLKNDGNAPVARSLKMGMRTFAAFLIAAILFWHGVFWVCFGRPGSYLPAIPAFMLICGPYICLAFTLALTWDYFQVHKWDKSIFVLGLATSLSPLFFFGLIVAVTFWKNL